MNAKEKKKLEVLRNYIEKAIWKSIEIETTEKDKWKITKINAELTKLIELLDEINQ